jgi:outer membrane protein assembly factor BamB
VDLEDELAEPLIADGRVLLAVRNSDGSYGNQLYALQLDTGSTLWGPVGVPGTYWMRQGLAIADGRLFTMNYDGLMRTFDAATGAGLWSTKLPDYSYLGAPVAFGGLLFTSGYGGTQALDPITGDVLWARPFVRSDAAPAVTGAALYVVTGYDCVVYALNPLTGENLWLDSACDFFGRDIAAANGQVYARSDRGHVGIYDAATGADAGFSASNRAVAIGDSALITLYSGTLTATSLANGAQLWQFTGDGYLNVAPIIVNDTVFVGTTTGKVYGVDLATGAQQWMGTTPALGWSSSTYATITAGEGWLIVNGDGIVAAWPLQ